MQDASQEPGKDYDSVGAIAKLASSGKYTTIMQVSQKIPNSLTLAQKYLQQYCFAQLKSLLQ